jgi:hypothetical protein
MFRAWTLNCVYLLVAVTFASSASANSLICDVEKKSEVLSDLVYSAEHLARSRFDVRLDRLNNTVSRCSFSSSAGRVTCDLYEIDKIERTLVGATYVEKFYYFRGQFDLQVFGNKRFIENNGRGSIAVGSCISN